MKPSRLDVDTLLVFFLLAVTVSQMGFYLASYAPGWMKSLGYLQAAAFDAAIWRSSWWYKRDRSEKRRRVSLLGVLVFSAMSAFFNYGYYTLRAPTLPGWHRALMAAVLPAGVALLSYLAAQHEPAPARTERTEREPSAAVVVADVPEQTEHIFLDTPNTIACSVCGWERNLDGYNDKRAALNALAGHMRAHRNTAAE